MNDVDECILKIKHIVKHIALSTKSQLGSASYVVSYVVSLLSFPKVEVIGKINVSEWTWVLS